MAADDQLLYLEPDDEITSVVRRLREADGHRVVIVASGRSKPTNSLVALRLLAQVATEEGRELAIVADAGARALAGEAGIPAFASVAEASAEDAVPLEPVAPRRAPIRIVRSAPTEPAAPVAPVVSPMPERDRNAETRAVVLPPAPTTSSSTRPRRSRAPRPPAPRRLPRVALAAIVALLLVAGALLAAVVPAASIVIRPKTVDIGPVTYQVTAATSGTDAGEIEATQPGTATGVHRDPTPATGVATFLNWNTVDVEVPAGTVVSAGDARFQTLETIVVDNGQFGLPIEPGRASVAIQAVEAGPDGNVDAEAIDTIEDTRVRVFLRGFPNNPNRLVINGDPTTGGALNEQPRISRRDVDRAEAALRDELNRQLEERLSQQTSGRVYAPPTQRDVTIDIPDGLVGTVGEESFQLTGRLAYSRPYAERGTVEDALRARLLGDVTVTPAGMTILQDSVTIEIGAASGTDEGVEVTGQASGRAAHNVDASGIPEQVTGLTDDEVIARLHDLGDVSVQLWPGWVDRVPALPWRVLVEVRDPAAENQ